MQFALTPAAHFARIVLVPPVSAVDRTRARSAIACLPHFGTVSSEIAAMIEGVVRYETTMGIKQT